MTQLWAVQTKLRQEDSTLHLVDAFQKLGLNWAAFPLLPFDTYVPDFNWSQGPIVYYGSTQLVKHVYASPMEYQRARLYYNAFTHRPSLYGFQYEDLWLNADCKMWRASALQFAGRKFLRPNQGTKQFAGGVFSWEEWNSVFSYLKNQGAIKDDDEVVVAPVKEIVREYRTWVVDGECAAAVGYRRNDKVDPWLEVPQEIKDFSSKAAKVYSPSEVFVLDVAETPEGLKVVEINCFHSSGFYLPEVILDVVAEVSNFVAKERV